MPPRSIIQNQPLRVVRKFLLVDIDHTLSAAHWRDGLMPEDHLNGNWDEYHEKSVNDPPIKEVVHLVTTMSRYGGWSPIGLTARPGKWRTLTWGWLFRNKIPLAELLMRPDNNYRNSSDLKLDLFHARFPNRDGLSFLFLEDHPEVAKAFMEINITVLQVHASKIYHNAQ